VAARCGTSGWFPLKKNSIRLYSGDSILSRGLNSTLSLAGEEGSPDGSVKGSSSAALHRASNSSRISSTFARGASVARISTTLCRRGSLDGSVIVLGARWCS
jgi:hypothetical protein